MRSGIGVTRGLLALAAIGLLSLSVRARQGGTFSGESQVAAGAGATVLRGNVHPLARPEFDRGAAPASLALNRMLLVLKRGTQQEWALETLLEQQQDKTSPNYHHWLTPQEFGNRFGASDEDIQTVASWLAAQGFQISRVGAGRTFVEFSGTAATVKQAFRTEIHKYVVNGESHWATASDPSIPADFAGLVAGVASMNDFRSQPMHHLVGTFSGLGPAAKSMANPDFTQNCGGQTCYPLVPYDFATIYNVLPLWNATPGIDGTGQSIALVARTNINLQDVANFRALAGLPANAPTVIVDGPDPGIVKGEDETESDLDAEWSGAVAKGATIDLVVSQSTATTDGVDLSALYIVDNDLAPVMSESYGLCEADMGAAGNQFYNNLWQQAAAEGISVFVSAGDSGSAGCDRYEGTTPQAAQRGLAVNGLASTPYNVAVGGTDFNEYSNAASFWNTTNNPTTQESAKGYIPEVTWNDSCTNALLAQFGISCNSSGDYVVTDGAGGGESSIYAKPSWQSGPGVPADGKRDMPDVSLFASNGFEGSFYVLCEADQLIPYICSPTTYLGIGGTSASSPEFAALLALVNQKTGQRQGNPNSVLYQMAANQSGTNCAASSVVPAASCIFNDITEGTIAMPCAIGSPNCIGSTPETYGILSGYTTGGGYDLATGLGSVNASNLVNNWGPVNRTASSTNLTLNNGAAVAITHGASVPVSITVSPTSPEPTGDLSLIASPSSGPLSIGTFTLGGGAASGSTNMLPGGSYNVAAHYEGDATYAPGDSNSVAVTVNPEPSATSIALQPITPNGLGAPTNAITYGMEALLRFGVTNSSGTACFNTTSLALAYGCPTGSVAVTNNGAALGSGSFKLNDLGYAEDGGVQLTAGTYNLAASYSGDSSYNASSGASAITVTPAPTLTNSGTTSVQKLVIGTPGDVYIEMRTANTGSYQLEPLGTFTVADGGMPLPGSSPGGAGVIFPSPGAEFWYETDSASFPVDATGPPGPHALTATYSGDANYLGSTSSPFTVDEVYGTQTALTSSAPSIQYGQSTTLTATVTPSQSVSSPPSGTVTFSYGPIAVIGTSPLMNGQAQITAPAELSGFIYAIYSGDSNYGSSGADFDETVSPASTTTTLTSSNATVLAGRQVTFTAQVTPAQSGADPLSGSVNFSISPSTPGTAPYNYYQALSAGQAQVTTSFPTGGSYQIQASYQSFNSYQYAASSSPVITETVSAAPALELYANPSNLAAINPGQAATTTLTFTALNGLAGSATLSPQMCRGLPPESTCSFSPGTVNLTSTTTSVPVTLTIKTTAPSAVFPAIRAPKGWPKRPGELAIALALLLGMVLLVFRRKPFWKATAFVLALSAMALAFGCGGGSSNHDPGTLQGTYNVTVTGAVNGATNSVNVTVNVE